MAGSIQLYTLEDHQGLRSYTLGTFTITDLEKDTDYYEDFCQQQTVASLGRDIWAVKLRITTTGIGNLTVNKTYSPIPATTYDIYNDSYLVPSNCNLEVAKLNVRPADWDIHWRDKYNTRNYTQLPGPDITHGYSSGDNVAPTSGGTPYELPFSTDTYSATNQGRWLFWTLGDIYFAIEGQWYMSREYSGAPLLPTYEVSAFSLGSTNPDSQSYSPGRRYVNSPRENGISGPYIFNADDNYDFQARKAYRAGSVGPANPRIYINFINFDYPITLPSGAIETKQMVGVAIWEVGADGIAQTATISAFEKEFWEGTPEPPNDGPTSGPQGGRGTFSAPSDNRGDRSGATAAQIASIWNGNVITAGYNNYYISPSAPAAFQEMCERLWDPDVIQSWINQAQSPLQAIITCHQVPANLGPTNLGTAEIIKAAGLGLSDTTADTFSQYITSYHVGDVDISQYTDAFADFTNTSVYIHLPYVGTYQLDTAACMHGWIAVDYLCDITSGHCTALITTQDKFGNTEIRYEFKGDCSKTVPLYQRENPWANIIGSALPTIANVGVAAITGGAGAAIASGAAVSGLSEVFGNEIPSAHDALIASKTAQALDTAKHLSIRSGAIGGALGTLSSSATSAALSGSGTVQSNASGGDVSSPIDTTCWVLITRPQWSAPELYDRERAYPSDISGEVDDFSGLLVVSSCELNGIDCTDSELHEIDGWLKSGVLLD